jgi:Amt family ammonium transporter
VNAQYAGLEFHYVYLAVCSFLVWFIVPGQSYTTFQVSVKSWLLMRGPTGIGLLYSGLSRRKSALAMLFQSFMVFGVYANIDMYYGYRC